MNIWQWVNETQEALRAQGQGRLADLIKELPGAACDDRPEQVDAIGPEALALARGLEMPWVEVFVRHWILQSRVAHRMDATALPEALRLVDFAHDEAARGCPQAVCTVQDLTICYAHVDGPGYAEQRLSVADETLARIDPSWPCFECISEERADALRDLGRHQEALDFFEAQQRAAQERNRTAFMGRFRIPVRAHLALSRPEEALACLDRHQRYVETPDRREEAALLRAIALARLGRAVEGRAAFLGVGDPLRLPSQYRDWAEAAEALVTAGVLDNDSALGATLARMAARLLRQGVGRAVIDVAAVAGRLAVARGDETLTQRALAAMERAEQRLAAPLDAPDQLAALRSAVATVAAPGATQNLPDTADAADAAFRANPPPTPGARLAALDEARRRWPDDPRFALGAWNALRQLGLDEDARDVIAAFAEAHPEVSGAVVALGLTLLALRDDPGLDRLTGRLLASPDPVDGHFLLAQRASRDKDLAGAIRHGLEVLARNSEADNTRRLVYGAAIQRGELALALRMARELVERSPEPGPADWARIVAGSAAGAWDEVRESAGRLGMSLPGEGPIDLPGELCRLRFDDADAPLFARRIGPATARVVEIAGPGRDERYGDVVVFEPSPLDESEDADAPRLYAAVHTLSSASHRSYVVDGVHPGDDALQALKTALAARGATLQVVSGSGYQLHPGGAEAPILGVYAYLALPPELSVADASTLLHDATAGWAEPPTWIGLAKEAGDTSLVEEHERRAVRLGL